MERIQLHVPQWKRQSCFVNASLVGVFGLPDPEFQWIRTISTSENKNGDHNLPFRDFLQSLQDFMSELNGENKCHPCSMKIRQAIDKINGSKLSNNAPEDTEVFLSHLFDVLYSSDLSFFRRNKRTLPLKTKTWNVQNKKETPYHESFDVENPINAQNKYRWTWGVGEIKRTHPLFVITEQTLNANKRINEARGHTETHMQSEDCLRSILFQDQDEKGVRTYGETHIMSCRFLVLHIQRRVMRHHENAKVSLSFDQTPIEPTLTLFLSRQKNPLVLRSIIFFLASIFHYITLLRISEDQWLLVDDLLPTTRRFRSLNIALRGIRKTYHIPEPRSWITDFIYSVSQPWA